MAICLENLKQGVGVQTTCHANGWTPAGVQFYLFRNKEYKEWKASHPAKPANVKQYERRRLFDWRSKQYATEKEFQSVVGKMLENFQITFEREKKLSDSRDRTDFAINGAIYIECKICTKPFKAAIGQAVHYKRAAKEVWICIPDDIFVRSDELETLKANGIQVFHEKNLREKFAGKEIFEQIQTKTTGVYGFCKCCENEKTLMSRSPSGDARSYCIDCEAEVKQRVFDQHLNRWVKPA